MTRCTPWTCRWQIEHPIPRSTNVRSSNVVVTKDSDFVDSFLLKNEPWKLLLVSTGNIRNSELKALFVANIEKIAAAFVDLDFIEINQSGIIYHS